MGLTSRLVLIVDDICPLSKVMFDSKNLVTGFQSQKYAKVYVDLRVI